MPDEVARQAEQRVSPGRRVGIQGQPALLRVTLGRVRDTLQRL
jgi:hypothetical protein